MPMNVFSTYKVKISKKPFVTEEGVECNQTAVLTFYDRNNNEIDYLEKGYREREDLL